MLRACSFEALLYVGIASSLRWIQVSLKLLEPEVVASMQQKERPV